MSERMRWKCHQQIDGKCVMNETTWFEWGHCVVICTTNAITNIDNLNETQSEQCQTVDDAIKSQRSLRSIKREVDPNETNKEIVNVTKETPARNYRNVKYAIINQSTLTEIISICWKTPLPMSEVSEFFKWDCKTQETTDDVWRNAPHMITTYFDRNEARTSWTMEEGTRYLT